jgi:RimJ/RimL family protein N-acetyltransferase
MNDLTLLETDRLVLSGWRAEQAEDLYRLHGDPQVARYLTARGHPWTRREMDRALAHWIDLFSARRMGKLRVTRKSDGVLVGRCGFATHGVEEIPELGFALYPQYWGHGYAFEAASALRDWYFRETDGPFFIGMADVANKASQNVLRRIGMTKTHVGDNGQGHHCQFFIRQRR